MKAIKIFISSVLVILVFMACATTKHKLVETSNIEKDTLYAKHDSIHIKTINQPINDLIFIPIETGNPKIDSVINKRFSNFKTYKKSGDNSYKIAYNKTSKGFDISSKIGRTENSLVKKLDSTKSVHRKKEKEVEKQVVIKYRIPKWFLIFFAISLIAVYFLSKLKVI